MFKKVSLSTIFQIGILVVIGIMFCMTGNILGGVSGDSSTLEYDHNMDTENYPVEVTLGEDNSYLVSETIQVDMLRERHGIYRYIPMKGTVKSTIVDSRPIPTAPPSMIISMASPRSSSTCCAVVGLGLPDVLALGAATYPPAARISAAATGSLGKRTATLSSPPVVSIGTISDF